MGINTDPKLLEAFELMWGHYPASAMLIHKSRLIVAANAVCRAGGREPGSVCAKWGDPEAHKGCLAGKALAEQKAQSRIVSSGGVARKSYWLPVAGYHDYYVHFSSEPIGVE